MYSEWGCWAALVVGDVTLLHDEGMLGDFAWWTGFVLGVGIFEDFWGARRQAIYMNKKGFLNISLVPKLCNVWICF